MVLKYDAQKSGYPIAIFDVVEYFDIYKSNGENATNPIHTNSIDYYKDRVKEENKDKLNI